VYVQCRTTLHVMLQIAPDWARGAGCTRGPINKVAVFLSCCRPDRGDARAPQSFFCLRAERLEGNRVIYRHTTPTEPNNQPTGSTQPSSACPRPTQPSSPSGPHPPT
jgi:hypothetical protein